MNYIILRHIIFGVYRRGPVLLCSFESDALVRIRCALCLVSFFPFQLVKLEPRILFIPNDEPSRSLVPGISFTILNEEKILCNFFNLSPPSPGILHKLTKQHCCCSTIFESVRKKAANYHLNCHQPYLFGSNYTDQIGVAKDRSTNDFQITM